MLPNHPYGETMNSRWTTRAAGALLFSFALSGAYAQPGKADANTEMMAASMAVRAAMQAGPVEIPLGNQAKINLPEGYAFVPQPQANQLLKAMGNSDDPSRLGLILPRDSDSFIVPRFIDAGYIEDDEAADWDAEDLLSSIKEGTKEGNAERIARGIPEMEIVGWTQKPSYDKASHRLVWAIESKNKGAAKDEHGVNYNTYVLGREGYLSMNLVSGLDSLAANKPLVQTLLAQTSFNPGKTYGEFNASTDKVAEYGIAALVTGVAAKKLGLFALVGAFLLKFAKVILIGGFALVAGLGKFFKRDKA